MVAEGLDVARFLRLFLVLKLLGPTGCGNCFWSDWAVLGVWVDTRPGARPGTPYNPRPGGPREADASPGVDKYRNPCFLRRPESVTAPGPTLSAGFCVTI